MTPLAVGKGVNPMAQNPNDPEAIIERQASSLQSLMDKWDRLEQWLIARADPKEHPDFQLALDTLHELRSF